MRSAAWYEANSFCSHGETRHEGTPIIALDGELVGHLCANCLERVRQVRRGLPLWILEEVAL